MIVVIVAVAAAFFLLINMSYAKGHGAKICENPAYSCYVVKKGDSWHSLFSDENQRDLVMRINRMNTRLYPGLKIAIPQSAQNNLMDHSPLPLQIDPPGTKIILITLSDLAFGAYNPDGNLQHWGPISSGRGYCPDVKRRCGTPTGKYTIYEKRGPGCVSTKFPVGRGGAPMPYCMFYHGGYALHGSYTVPGYHDSHGCVRLFVNDAKWLNQEFTSGERVRVIIQR